jgi:hypothetical protein
MDFHHHGTDSARPEALHVLHKIWALRNFMAATMQQVLDDLDEIKTEFDAYVTKRDNIDDGLRAEIAKLLAGNPAVQAQVDSAFAKAEAQKALLTMTTTLSTTFVDKADFVKQVDLYNGPEKITLDGNLYAGGTDPALDYFSHSQDGHIDMVGPTS